MNDRVGPLAWYNENAEGMVLAVIAAMSMATVSHFLRNARGVSVLVTLLCAFALVGMVIPFLAIFYGLAWYWWPPVGALLGVSALSIVWIVIRFTGRIENRAEDLADGAIDRVLPGTPRSGGQP